MLPQMFAVALVLMLALIGGAGAQSSLEQDLLRLEERRQAAYVAGDMHELERQIASEYVHTNLRGDRTNREAELAFYRPGAFRLHSARIEGLTVHRYADVATMTGDVIWEGAEYHPNPTTTIDLSGRYSVSRVYVRRNNRWQLALSHASQIPPLPGG